ncbi:MAG TPA: NAD(P)H-dependent oxidoreductase [Telluria sp.]|jgi:NAD(P)H-dependent FMN reductase
MKITIVSGSHRAASQSIKVSTYIQRVLCESDVAADVVDLAGNPLPLWDDEVWAMSPRWQDLWAPIAGQLRASEGFVFVVPEWAGMVPSGFKNFLLLCGNKELGHKPALIVSISASGNGVYPVAELRMASAKNNHLVYIPDHVIVRNVKSVLNAEPCPEEQGIRDRLDYSLQTLCGYARHLAQFRRSFNIDYRKYGYGM